EVLRGGVRVPGVHGNALYRNGDRQQGFVPGSPTLDPGSALTLAAWVKPEKASGTQYLIKKMELSQADGYELTLLSGGTFLFRINQKSGGSTYSVSSLGSYPGDGSTWVHIAATYDGTTMRLYLDGVESGSKSVSAGVPVGSNDLGLTIGGGTNGAYSLQGSIDDVRIYGMALGAADIRALAEVPPVPQSAPVPVSPSSGSVGVSLPAV